MRILSTTTTTRALTLLEILIVIAIIAIMAAILAPLAGRVRIAAQCTKGASNLRQIGTAIAHYAADNDGRLPGPLRSGQKPWYYADPTEPALAYLLQTYLGLPVPVRYPAKNPYFLTPRWEEVLRANTQDTPSCLVNDLGGPANSPWGYPTYIYRDAKRVWTIENPASTWAIKDLDKQNASPTAGWYSQLPDKPIYGNVRNVMYFDWHVEAVSLEADH